MLTFTAPAIDAIRMLTSKSGLPEKSGLRIVHQDTAGSLSLSISPGPEPEDEVIEVEDVRVYLQAEAASMLSGRTLRAEISDDDVVFRVD